MKLKCEVILNANTDQAEILDAMETIFTKELFGYSINTGQHELSVDDIGSWEEDIKK